MILADSDQLFLQLFKAGHQLIDLIHISHHSAREITCHSGAIKKSCKSLTLHVDMENGKSPWKSPPLLLQIMDALFENIKLYCGILRKCSLPEVDRWEEEDLDRAIHWADYFDKVHGGFIII